MATRFPRCVLLISLLWAPPGRAADRTSLVLVTLDTARADRMGFLGSPRGLTPNLDALAREALVFARAHAQAPITTVSHATILSGTFPQRHGVNDFGVPLPVGLPWLPDEARRAGYRTGAFVGSLILDPRGGLAPGFDRGFDVYDAGFRAKRGKDDRYLTMERRGGEVVDRALRWLDGGASGPFLLWVHLYDPHDPYDAPPPYGARFAQTPYDGEIAYADAQVGRLVSGLKAQGRFADTALAVFADHGESLGEHGESTHGVFLYDATIRVPLLLKLPAARGAGQRVATRVSLVDLAPTLLEAAGLPVPPGVQGQSLLPLLGAPGPDRPAYSETDYPRRAFGWSPLAAWRVDRFLYVKAPRRELYDLASDPEAARNLAEERALVADRVAADLESFRKRTMGSSDPLTSARIDPELQEKLLALGYVSGGAVTAAPGGVDPKDKVGVANALHDAILALEGGEPGRAGSLLEHVVATDPQIPMAHLQLGVARCRERRYREAIPALRRAIELQPDSVMAHYEMGIALYETGDLRTAAGHLEIVVAKMTKFADARFSLGSILARIDRVEEAKRELLAALELEPRHYRANLLYGRILTLQGQAAPALGFLERAAEVNPESAEAQAFLAEAYAGAGRAVEAERARARAQQLRRPGS